jgi:prepilin-type N-terminal cleavage/methylation domain-containing protein
MHFHSRKKNIASKGFTLIELLVVMGIMGLMMGVIISNHSRFGGKILLRTLAYDTALSLRQAQTFGISVRQSADVSDVTNFNAGYGIFFDSATPTNFKLYADTVSDGGLYTTDTVIESYNLTRGYKIKQLCYTSAAGVESCSLSVGATKLHILFVRPEPDALIRINADSSVIYQRARIQLESPRGDLQDVIIEVSGQISVQAT